MKLSDYRYVRSHVDAIEAFQITEQSRWDNSDWPAWLNEAWSREADELNSLSMSFSDSNLLILYSRGVKVTIVPGDWIVRYRVQTSDREFYLARVQDAAFRMRFKPYIEPSTFWIWLKNWWRTAPW